MFLITEWFGAFLLDGDGRVTDERLFPREPVELAAVLKRLDAGEVLEEERALAGKAGGGGLRVVEERLLQVAGAALSRDGFPGAGVRAGDYNFTRSLLHEASLELGRRKMRDALSKRDLHILQAVDAIDELAAQGNILVERLREWYGIHFPELVEKVERNEEVAALVSANGRRENVMEKRPDLEVESMGGPLTDADEEALRTFARTASNAYNTRAQLEKYLDDEVPKIAPNLAVLLGPVLAARMIRTAGGLKRLALLPSGTIQTLGAEKALFRHIKEGSKPPKHGLLFQHPALHRAPRWQRGALARALAGKVALAARADAITGDADVGERMVREFETRAAEIARQRGRAPSRGPPRGKHRGGSGRGGGGGGGPRGGGRGQQGFRGGGGRGGGGGGGGGRGGRGGGPKGKGPRGGGKGNRPQRGNADRKRRRGRR